MAMGSSRRPSPPVRVRAEVFAVGRRVYVMCKESARMILMDETGKTPLASLDDGVEVQILGWRPGWAGSTRYRVRATLSGLEGWLLEASLRGTEVVVPVAPPTPAVADSAGSGRRFGESAHRR